MERMRGGEQLTPAPAPLEFPADGNIPGCWKALSVKVFADT